MNTIYLAIQHTYTEVQAGLYHNNRCLDTIAVHKHQASSLLVEKIKELLIKHKTPLNQIAFIAVNQGPGPFTTLRVVIATVNGISFALGIPLVGVDGIKALLSEYQNPQYTIHVALLNAFNQDVYFATKGIGNSVQTGYENISALLARIQDAAEAKSICFFGNGATMHSALIKEQFPHAQIDTTLEHCSLNAIARAGFSQWQDKHSVSLQLQPLYLKSALYKPAPLAK